VHSQKTAVLRYFWVFFVSDREHGAAKSSQFDNNQAANGAVVVYICLG
jgi:hypothetical protein